MVLAFVCNSLSPILGIGALLILAPFPLFLLILLLQLLLTPALYRIVRSVVHHHHYHYHLENECVI